MTARSDQDSTTVARPGPPGVLELGSEAASLAQARLAVAHYLRRRCPWADPGAVALVLSELLANAVRHAHGWWRLRVTGDEARLVVEVRDRSHEPPRLLTPDPQIAAGGLGMHIVTKLATSVQVEPVPGAGKSVRATWLRSAALLPEQSGRRAEVTAPSGTR